MTLLLRCAICDGTTWVRQAEWSLEMLCVRCWIWAARFRGIPAARWCRAPAPGAVAREVVPWILGAGISPAAL